MSDIEDQVVKALQSYAQTLSGDSTQIVMAAMAERMAPHLIKELGLKQEWAIAAASVNKDGSERVDDIYCDDTNRERVVNRLGKEHTLDRSLYGTKDPGLRRYLISRLFTGWEEEVDPVVDEDLAALVAEDTV